MNTDLTIRELMHDDLSTISSWSQLGNPTLPGYVAIRNGQIVACLTYWFGLTPPPTSLHINYLETHPEHRLKGYGRALIHHLQQHHDFSVMIAEWVQWQAVLFWERMGFQPDNEEEWNPDEDEHAGNYQWW